MPETSSSKWPTPPALPPPRRSHDSRPSSPIWAQEDSRRRSSSDGTTPKQVKTPIHTELHNSLPRRPKPSIPGTSSSNLNTANTASGSQPVTGPNDIPPRNPALHPNAPFRSVSRNDSYPSREAASSPIPSGCAYGLADIELPFHAADALSIKLQLPHRDLLPRKHSGHMIINL